MGGPSGPRMLDFSPKPRTEPTVLERTLSAFSNQYLEREQNRQESDALASIYRQYQEEGRDIERAFGAIQSNPMLSPTAKVNASNQLLNLAKHNYSKQVDAKKQHDQAQEEKRNEQIIADLEQRRGLEPGSLAAYKSDPKMAEQISRPAKEPKKTQASQPIDPEQLQLIQSVRAKPEYEDASPAKKYQMLTDAGVSKENADAEAKIYAEDLKISNAAVDTAYKAQEKFINDTTSSYRGFETDTKPKLLQMQKLATDDELVGPTAAVFLDTLGIPLGALENPASELYQKLSLDLLKGLPETYGNRILKVEVDNFLKTVPQLVNSPEGRRMIASNMLKLGEMKEVYYNEMRKQQQEYLDKNKPLPRDFQQRVFDQVRPQIDRINNEFVKLSEITSVPKDHIPFFAPNGEIKFVPKEHADWAAENGGRRIW